MLSLNAVIIAFMIVSYSLTCATAWGSIDAVILACAKSFNEVIVLAIELVIFR